MDSVVAADYLAGFLCCICGREVCRGSDSCRRHSGGDGVLA
uniref:Uncharacterized protein n=1 Tax=Escherichia coli TaxID=562 RepID=X5FE79_ECOLX|nr:hypothetical protein [Escherichia coli]AHW84720.1 hypothetical protein [Escherichia coli]